MQLEHSFTVPVSVDEAWRVLLDIERVAPCLPGASLDSLDGDEFTGGVKVRVGPIALQYKGKAAFVEKDEAAHRAVLDAQGRDTRGNGTARATVTTSLLPDGELTRVEVVTDLSVTGKPAQFGRGVIVDVSNKLIGQFADCLAGQLSGTSEAPAGQDVAGQDPMSQGVASQGVASQDVAGAGTASASTHAAQPTRPQAVPSAGAQHSVQPDSINLLSAAGPAIAKRAAPPLLGFLLLVTLFRRRRRRHLG